MNKQTKITAPLTLPLPELRRAVDIVARAASHGHTIFLLLCIRIKVADGQLTLTATDLDRALRFTMPCDGPPLDVAVSAARLAKMLRAMTGEVVTLSLGDTTLTVIGEDCTFGLAMTPAGDWPELAPPDCGELEWNAAKLRSDLAFVMPAISKEHTRYYLNGVCFAGMSRGFELVATDGHRLHVASWPSASVWPSGSPILPADSVSLLVKLLAAHPECELVQAQISRERSIWKIGSFELLSKMIDGAFPDYTKVIPKPAGMHFSAGAPALIAAARLASAALDEPRAPLKLIEADGKLVISCRTPEGDSARVSVRGGIASGFDPAKPVGLNAHYLNMMCRVWGKADLHYSAEHEAAPTLWTSPDAPDRLCVLMPVRVDSSR